MARVLVVDGDTEQRLLMVESLAHEHNVVGEDDGQAAFVRMNIAPVDLLVLDLLLPTVSGADLLRRLDKNELLTCPVVVVSALNTWGLQRVLGEYTKRVYILSKPFTVEDFQEAVRAALPPTAYGLEPTPLQIEERDTWPLRVARTQFRGEVSLRLGMMKLFAEALNLSTQGIAVRTKLPVDVGRRLELELTAEGVEALPIDADVKWTERVDNMWVVGMTFTGLDTYTREALLALLDFAVDMTRQDDQGRAHVRVPVSGPIQVTPMTTNRPLAAVCTDLSEGGLGVTVRERIDVGESILLGLDLPASGTRLHPRAQVRWTEGEAGDDGELFHTGLEFDDLHPVYAEQIRAFVTSVL